MTKKKKIIFGVAAVLAVAGGLYIWKINKRERVAKDSADNLSAVPKNPYM